MTPLISNYLFKEHNFVTEAIGVVKNEMAYLRSGELPRKDKYDRLLQFFRDYVDTVHHAKEEDILFREVIKIPNIPGGPRCIYYKELQMQRPSILSQVKDVYSDLKLDVGAVIANWTNETREGSLISPLIEEHIFGRSLVKLIEKEVCDRTCGRSNNNSALLLALYRYVELLEEHVEKENTCFGNTLDNFVPEETQIRVVKSFEEMDAGPAKDLIYSSLKILEELKTN